MFQKDIYSCIIIILILVILYLIYINISIEMGKEINNKDKNNIIDNLSI